MLYLVSCFWLLIHALQVCASERATSREKKKKTIIIRKITVMSHCLGPNGTEHRKRSHAYVRVSLDEPARAAGRQIEHPF